MSSVNTLSMKDNIILQGLSEPEKDRTVWARDLGYNKIQQLADFMTQKAGGAIALEQKRFDVYSVGNTSISAEVAVASVVSGAYLTVTIVPGANSGNFREGDIVYDNNAIAGRIDQVISENQFILTISDPSVSAWNASTHFTAGMQAGVTNMAAKSRGSRGRVPLQVFPEGDYNYIQTMRESGLQFIDDGIKSYVKVNGKNWYTTNQMMTLERFSRQKENWTFWSNRYAQGLNSNNEVLQSGNIRWSIMNRGGTYNAIGNKLTRNDLHDTMNAMARKSAIRGNRELWAFMGQQAMSDIQELTYNNIIYAGTQNTFGGATVSGWNVMKYVNAGVTLNYVHWPMLDDPNLFGMQISSITGKPKWSSSILLMDTEPVASIGGRTNVPVIQKVYFKNAGEYKMKYLPGMMDMSEMNGGAAIDISVQSGMSLAVSDLDACAFELYGSCAYYIIAEKMGLIELAA